MNDTIYALSSAPGIGGVAVIRVSGALAIAGLKELTRKERPVYRSASLITLKHPVSRETLDQALVLAFRGPCSYTGEDVVEYHVHGGMAVVRGVLSALSEMDNYRMAQPGEFTRRAFENGKMDLTEAEAIADLIHAETELQRTQALSQMGGALANIYEGWRMDLLKMLAHVEADLEFPDEDLPEGILPQILPKVEGLIKGLDNHLNDNRRGERLRNGIHIAIIGAPNAGKSSLVNALARRDIAIVSDIAGTTRDVIEAHLDIGGYPVILYDTAGLRPNILGRGDQDKIESEGIRRALKIAADADMRILLYDGGCKDVDADTFALDGQENSLSVINKADQDIKLNHPSNPLKISVKDNIGIDAFLQVVTERIECLVGKVDAPTLTRERHREALVDCRQSLKRCLHAQMPELAAEDLRLASRHLGRITGKVDVEDLLDVVFKDFCIGK